MQTKFKINTATHKAAVQKVQIAEKIMQKVGITLAQWASVLFEMGCVFVETNIRFASLRTALTQNKDLGYWDWWFMLFVEDDECLLDYPSINNISRYIREKERLLSLMETVNQFEYFLKHNTRLGEKI